MGRTLSVQKYVPLLYPRSSCGARSQFWDFFVHFLEDCNGPKAKRASFPQDSAYALFCQQGLKFSVPEQVKYHD